MPAAVPHRTVRSILCWLRGEHSQIVIEDGTYRGGQPIYIDDPFQ